MGLTKSIKNAGKSVKKATKTAVKATTNIANDAIDFVEDTTQWMVDTTTGLSKEAEKLAHDCMKELERIGDLALALLDDLFMAALEAFVDQILRDYVDTIDAAVSTIAWLAENPEQALDIAGAIETLLEDPVGSGKQAWVEGTRMGTIPEAVSAADRYGFKSVSMGVQGSDGSYGGASGVAANSADLDAAYANKHPAEQVNMGIYVGIGQTIASTSAAPGAGVEFGAWRDQPKDMAGDSLGVSLGLSYKVGVKVEVYVSTDITKFLGFNLVPQTGTSVELSVSEGTTTVPVKF